MAQKKIFDKKNVVIAGGAGFIGSHLCDELLKDSKVICIDNFSTGDERNIDHLLANQDFEFIRQDITEPFDLDSYPELEKFHIRFQGVQEVYNCACPTSPNNYVRNIISTLHANGVGLKNLLDLAVKHEAKFMHLSSSVIYGPQRKDESGYIKIEEKDIGVVDHLSDRGAYDEGKRFAEAMVDNYRRIFKIDTKIARIFRTYGPRMKLNDGEMIPDFIYNALSGKPLIIYGDTKFTTSLCYITDTIDGIMKYMESEVNFPVNIGSDYPVNITDIAKKIIADTGSASQIQYSDSILFLSPLCIPDIAKARNELGWMPVVTLDKGLALAIEDLRANIGIRNIEGIAV